MEIKHLKKCKSNLYEITLNNGEKYTIYDDIILKYELLIDKRIKPSKLKTLLSENECAEAYYKALKYINIKMRTKKEIKMYLEKKDISNEAIEYTINRLKKEGYLNEKLYVETYINDKLLLSLDGPKKIMFNLSKLGINENLIDEFLSKIEDNTWISRIEKIITKSSKTNKNSKSMFKSKLYNHLVMLGYESDMIKSIIDNYDIDTSIIFKKDAEKVWNTLEKKYTGDELIFRFKNKMYTKGYTSDEINSYINNN